MKNIKIINLHVFYFLSILSKLVEIKVKNNMFN